MKCMTSDFMWVPSREETTGESYSVSGTKLPRGKELGESKKSWEGTAHSLLEEDQIWLKGVEEGAKTKEFCLSSEASNIEGNDFHGES